MNAPGSAEHAYAFTFQDPLFFPPPSPLTTPFPGISQKIDGSFNIVTGDVVRLTGFRMPTFATADDLSSIGNVTLINLDLHVTSYSASGNWITGTTVIHQEYSGPGPYDATFSGCCVEGMPGNTPFSVSAKVDMSQSSFSPAIVPVPTIWAVPGGNVSLPAQHPKGILGPVAATAGASPSDFYMYKWTLDPSITGVTLDPHTGNLAVASTAAVGQRIWVIARVSVVGDDGSPLSSHGSIAFFVQTMAMGGPMPGMPAPQGLPGVNEMSRRYEVRTGFKLSIEVEFTGLTMPTSGDALELYTNERLPSRVDLQVLPAVEGQPPSKVVIAWDRPCVGDEQAIDFCFAAREVSTGLYTPQMCINMRVLMDIPPGFTEPVAEEFTAIMGRETSFRVSVVDAAAEDQVTNLGLASGYSLPTGASITGLALMGNTGHLTFSYTPSPSAGGGMVELCFITNDIPVSTYDRCRGGTRSSTKCVKIDVERCRYAVRPKETISDVAALFSTDWVQLWALNPEIREPDYEVNSLATPQSHRIHQLE
jgi:hypothetical protein